MMDAARKQELIGALDRERRAISESWQGLRREADIPRKLRQSIRKQTAAWLAAAAVTGWILSRLPARRKKVYLDSGSRKLVNPSAKRSIAWELLKFVAAILRPAAIAFAGKKFADVAAVGARALHRNAA